MPVSNFELSPQAARCRRILDWGLRDWGQMGAPRLGTDDDRHQVFRSIFLSTKSARPVWSLIRRISICDDYSLVYDLA
ncbi:hypothetical protein Pla52n_33200 [Stieleria varia]|uniref:Uncharacterized protein n=1 Tax=Stieleria varia TaxID=2528005 RepID=A0A5C6ARB6_9BACT|nr:hypothetical protein Pla52n_33200 [Stieleria varia]